MAKKMVVSLAMYNTPLPSENLALTMTELPKSMILHRIHNEKYNAEQFNTTSRGNARFSPIRDKAESIIPTLYGGSTKECVMMETIFHDVP